MRKNCFPWGCRTLEQLPRGVWSLPCLGDIPNPPGWPWMDCMVSRGPFESWLFWESVRSIWPHQRVSVPQQRNTQVKTQNTCGLKMYKFTNSSFLLWETFGLNTFCTCHLSSSAASKALHVQRHHRFISFLFRLSPPSVGRHLPKPAEAEAGINLLLLGWTPQWRRNSDKEQMTKEISIWKWVHQMTWKSLSTVIN